MKLFRLSVLFFFITLATSCIRDVERLQYPDNAKTQLVLLSIISPQDSVIHVRIKRTGPFFGNSNTYNNVRDASVFLSDGSDSIQLSFVSDFLNNTNYTDLSSYRTEASRFRISPGKTYFLSVSTPNGTNLKSHCNVPDNIRNFERVALTPYKAGKTIHYPYALDITLETNNKTLYYDLFADVLNEEIIQLDTHRFVQKQWLSYIEFVKLNRDSLHFNFEDKIRKDTNRQISTANLNIYFRIYDENSSNLYFNNRYTSNPQFSNDSTSVPEEFLFTEPANYFTNIEGGFGIFGATNETIIPK